MMLVKTSLNIAELTQASTTVIHKSHNGDVVLTKYRAGYSSSYYWRHTRETMIVIDGTMELNSRCLEKGDICANEAGVIIDLVAVTDTTVIRGLTGFVSIDDASKPPKRPSAASSHNPLVSIIVTAFNVSDVIGITLMSLLQQSYDNIEIIVVDDASTDKTPGIVTDFCNRYDSVSVIRSSTNIGAAAAKRLGLSKVKGDYFLICDGDDFIDPNTVSECIKTMHVTKSDVVVFGFDHFGMGDGVFYQSILPVSGAALPYVVDLSQSHRDDPERLSRLSHITPICFMKTDTHLTAISSAIYDLPYYEDLPTFFAMIAAAKVLAFINEPYYHYRIGRGGQSIAGWTARRRGLKIACLESSIRKFLTTKAAGRKAIRHLMVFKVVRLALSEFLAMRGSGSVHDYDLTIQSFRTILGSFSFIDILCLMRRPKFLLFALATRFGSTRLVRFIVRRI